MVTFHWIAVVLSMILGLGVARLLIGAVSVFRSRRRARIDHLPIIWTSAIFIQQLFFWWSLAELPALIDTWSIAEFLLLVGLVLALFIAAALILPPSDLGEGESLRSYFEQDGYGAIFALVAFNAIAIIVDWVFWRASPWSLEVGLNLALIVIALAGTVRSRPVQVAAATLYLLLLIGTAITLSPASY